MSETKNKKLLILIDWFKPGYKAGGPIQSVLNICSALHNEYSIFVLTTDTDHNEKEPYKNIAANQWITDSQTGVQVFYAAKKNLSFSVIRNEIKKITPDIVYLNLLFSPFFTLYPLMLKAAGKLKALTILCPRGTLYQSALSVKGYKKRPLLLLLRFIGVHKKIRFHATNEREQQAILHSFPGSEIVIANNLPDMMQDAFVSCQKISGSVKCIFVSRIVPIKNLLFILQLLHHVKATVQFTIVGPMEDAAYWQKCTAEIKLLSKNIEVEYAGAKTKSAIKELLYQNHLFILPTKGENFGHAIFEALLAGRPVLISDQTPWTNLQQSTAGWDIALDDKNGFVKIIEQMATADQAMFDSMAKNARQYAANFISNKTLKQPYHSLFQ